MFAKNNYSLLRSKHRLFRAQVVLRHRVGDHFYDDPHAVLNVANFFQRLMDLLLIGHFSHPPFLGS